MKIQTMVKIDRVGQAASLIETIRDYERHGWKFISTFNIDDMTHILSDKDVKGLDVC
jgi:hypothetical protein